MLDLKPILAAVRDATVLAREVQRDEIVRAEKDAREPVTIADYGVQAVLCRAIAAAYPDDAILAEEQASGFASLLSDSLRARVVALVARAIGQPTNEAQVAAWLEHGRGREAERVWLIDPIDGTKGFLAGRRYSIAVSPLEHGTPIAGVLGSPGYPTPRGDGLLFYAQRAAAHMQSMIAGQPMGKPGRIAVSRRTQPNTLRAAESVERDHVALERIATLYSAIGITRDHVENVDSQDKYAMVACGDADLYLRLPREAVPQHRAWDHAAGAALVLAAGGSVTDLDGSALDFTTGAILANNRGMVVSNGLIHARVLEAIAALPS